MTSHLKRWMTGLISVPLLFITILFGSGEIFLILIFLMTLGAALEYNAMFFSKSRFFEKSIFCFAALMMPLSAFTGGISNLLFVLIALFVVAFLLFLLSEKSRTPNMEGINRIAFGLLYIPMMMSYLILLRDHPDGVLWIFFMVVLAFSGDTTAYYIGRKFGKHKLIPNISEGKTVEGTIGSILGSIIGCVVFSELMMDLSVIHALIIGFFGNIVGELGDLCESILKRSAGVKDSGFILPGHGGILDRLDCILFIAPFLFYYRFFIFD